MKNTSASLLGKTANRPINQLPEKGMLLSPNPAKDKLQVSLSRIQHNGNGSINIYDLKGKLLATSPIPYGHAIISVTQLREGIYICAFVDETGKLVEQSKLAIIR